MALGEVSGDKLDTVGQIEGNNSYHPGDGEAEYDELHVPCPPHTTERKIVSRIDLHLMPFVCILYLLAFLDRVNIANANSYKLSTDLNLSGVEYNTEYDKYSRRIQHNPLLAINSNYHCTLSGCMFGFGIVSVCQGLVQNYAGLLATRFFLGVFETGMFPGCFYLLGMWYRRDEAQKRYSLFFSSTSLAGAFGGLLASAIGEMAGIRGYNGWRWIFILEGCLTVVVAAIFFFVFPTFPEQAEWLNEEERNYVRARLQADQGRNAAERKIGARDVVNVLKEYRTWIGGLMYFGLIVPAYGYAFFAPAIIKTYNYSAIQTQLHSVPPWAVSFGFSLLIAAFSDWFKHRALFAIGPLALSITGFAILLSVHNNTSLEYAALFLVVMGTYGAMPIIVCWFNMNLGGHHRRAIGTAWQVGFGNIGGIIATYAFISTDAPKYTKGYAICIAFTSLSALASIAYFISNTVENRRRAKSARNVGLTDYEKTELGDLNPEFKYMI
ncbi:major facilitator superfamily domain-containing protein [Xylariales sp. PMI_506]|nr:major facilitator superfamily domain-containing protein [Xylariales sp. PMI_506]